MAQTLQDVLVEGELQVDGPFQAKRQAYVLEGTATKVCTSSDFGKLVLLSKEATVTITLPANDSPAGAIIDFLIIGNDSVAATWSPASATSLRTFNQASAASVTYGSGHRIGAYIRFLCDGAYWTAVNLSSANTLSIST